MTFDEYNTDANFDNDKSSLDELVKIGLSEGKTSDEIKSSLSPKWQKSKKIGEFDDYVTKYSTPKTEDKPAEEKTVEEVVAEEAGTPEQTELKSKEKSKTAQTQNDIAIAQEDFEKQRAINNKNQDWDNWLDTQARLGKSMKVIDDHYLEGLPTFIFRRYQNGEFGDLSTPEGKKDAKLRMAYFMINGVGTALQNASATIKGGAQQQSDIEKLKESQMTNAIQNRWEKNRQDTQSAINLAVKEANNEQDIYDAAARISSNNRLQSAFNRMNEDQKVYTLEVMAKVGDKLTNMNDEEFANTMFAFASMGDKLDKEELAAMLVYRFGKKALSDPSVKNWLESFGISLDDIDDNEKPASIGGNGNKIAELSDGTVIDPGLTMNNKEYQQVLDAANKLSQDYYDGKITVDEFRTEYKKLEDLMKSHPIKGMTKNIKSADSVIKESNNIKLGQVTTSLEELNANAGSMSPGDYNDQFDNLKENAKKWGASEKELKNIEKKRLSKEKILKAAEKKAKKK